MTPRKCARTSVSAINELVICFQMENDYLFAPIRFLFECYDIFKNVNQKKLKKVGNWQCEILFSRKLLASPKNNLSEKNA